MTRANSFGEMQSLSVFEHPGKTMGSGDLFAFNGIGAEYGMGATFLEAAAKAKNAPIMAVVKQKLEEYQKNRALIPSLPLKSQREAAMAIVLDNWRRNSNMDELAVKIARYAALPKEQFYYYKLENSTVELNDSRALRWEGFRKGNRALRNYLSQFLPIRVITHIKTNVELRRLGLDSDQLLNQARNEAQAARNENSRDKAIAARTIADQAREAARLEENSINLGLAQDLYNEMDTLVQQLGGAKGVKTDTDKAEEIPWGTIALLGGGALVLGVIIYMVMKK